jgi:hypothetical protein
MQYIASFKHKDIDGALAWAIKNRHIIIIDTIIGINRIHFIYLEGNDG